MTEPRIEEDLEIYFSHGEPLFVNGLVTGRDRTEIARDWMVIERHEQPGLDEVMRVDLSKVNCWRVTRRVIQPEPQAPDA